MKFKSFLWNRILSFPRSLLVTIWFYFHTLCCALLVIFLSPFYLPQRLADFIIKVLWASPVLFFAGIEVEVRGSELWPQNSGCLIIFNHSSWMDIIILSAKLPRVPRFGAKIELFSIPFFGTAMRKVGVLPIERKNRRNVLNIYREAEKRAANGECFALAPEGTRQTQLALGRFKRGPFLFAVHAQMPLLALVLAGARDTMPKSSWLLNNSGFWKKKVLVEILPPISTLGKSERDLEDIQTKAINLMGEKITQLNRELGIFK
ncbi:MAG: 1-acyl-sn-glycerol-3-phosphate acyltransferase [Bdellovibrionales bacterium]|nr:1-acyl-sn-glycerol-3-phosphate acyltransferase [Bdellovibrionales bacterium]